MPDANGTRPPYRRTQFFFKFCQVPPRNVPDALESSGDGVPPAMREYAAMEPTGQDGGCEALTVLEGHGTRTVRTSQRGEVLQGSQVGGAGDLRARRNGSGYTDE